MKCSIFIKEIMQNPNNRYFFVCPNYSIDIEDCKDKDEVKMKIEEIDVAKCGSYSDDVEAVEFVVKYNDKQIWKGKGKIINKDEGINIHRSIKIDGDIERIQ